MKLKSQTFSQDQQFHVVFSDQMLSFGLFFWGFKEKVKTVMSPDDSAKDAWNIHLHISTAVCASINLVL